MARSHIKDAEEYRTKVAEKLLELAVKQARLNWNTLLVQREPYEITANAILKNAIRNG